MSLVLKGTTNNSKALYLNTLILIDEDGNETTIDRDETEWGTSGDGSTIRILWKSIYTWNGDLKNKNWDYNNIELNRAFQNAVDFRIEIEEDASEDYELDITEISYNYRLPIEDMRPIMSQFYKSVEEYAGIKIKGDLNFEVLNLGSKMRMELTSVYKVLKRRINKNGRERKVN